MEPEARFARIEAVLERLTEAQLRGEQRLTDAVEQMAVGHKQLVMAHAVIADEVRKIAEAQAQTEVSMKALSIKSAETQEKLDALIHMWDDWIRERGGKNGAPPAA